MDSKQGLKGKRSSSLIDLYNFDEPQFEASQYILTSPRSLKPVELLHKPLSEFETELKSLGLSHTAIFAAYKKYEKQRLEKLQRARNKRQTLLADEERRRTEPNPHHASRITVTEPERPGVIPQKQQIVQTSTALTSSETVPQHGASVSSRLSDLELVGKSIEVHPGRVQSSQQKPNMSSTETKAEKSQMGSVYLKSALSKSTPSTAMPRTPKLRPNSQESRVSHRYRAITSNDAMSDSIGNGSVKVPVRKSKSEQWKRTGGQTFRDLTLADVPVRDQRILQLMTARRKEEQLLGEEQNAITLEWDREKEVSKQQQEVSERKYREMLEKLRRQSRETKEKERLRKEAEEREEFEIRRTGIERENHGWEERTLRIEREKLQKMQVKKLESIQKKRLLEARLQEKEEEEMILRSVVEERLEEDLEQAQQVRQEKAREKKLHVRVKNLTERQEYEQRRTAVEQEFSDEVDYLKSVLELKHARAEEQVQQSLAQREEILRMKQLKRVQREQVRQSAVGQMQDEMDFWRQGMTVQQQQAQERADAVAAEVVTDKSRLVHAKRMAKEHEHKQNLERVRQEEEEWKKQIEREVKIKDKRTDAVRIDKELQIQQSRQVARATEYMRSKITQGDHRPIATEPHRPRTTPSKYRTRDLSNFRLV